MPEVDDRLDAYVPRLLQTRWPGGARRRTVEGTVVFADISGFTKLSERLTRLGRVGAEELVSAICEVFTPLIEDIHAVGGDVLKFGGDALLFLVEGEGHAERAVAAAVDMRATLRRVGLVQTPIGAVRLRMSVGAHSGAFECLLVGRGHEELLVVGPAASTTVAMESAAVAGEILVSPETAAMLPRTCRGRVKGPGVLVAGRPPTPRVPLGPVCMEDADRFIPLALRGRLASVAAEAEHRQVTVAFVHLGDVDRSLAIDGVEATHERLDDVATAIIEVCADLGVTVICTDVADDGAKFMLTCGAPDAVEDAEARMLRACRAVLDRDHGVPLRIGVNRGAVFAGSVGSSTRFTYSTMGDAVNLAARVMGKAQPGQLLATTAVVDRSGGRFECTPLEPFTVKGKTDPVCASAVGPARYEQRGGDRVRRGFVGRTAELERLHELAAQAATGRGAAVEVVAGSGMGKSHLVDQVSRTWQGVCIDVVCEQYESATPYFAARQLVRAALGLDHTAGPDATATTLRAVVADGRPDLEPWLPLLAVVADATVSGTPEVDELAPEFRRARLAEAVVELLTAALEGPTLVRLEDTSWMDDASAAVIAAVERASVDRSWFLLSTARPEATGIRKVERAVEVIELLPLSPSETSEVYRSTTGHWPAPNVLAELVERAEGNPLFTVELAAAIARDGVEALPPSIEELLATQLDRLSIDDRRCLRYAAVAGTHVSLALLERAVGDLLPSVSDPERWHRLDQFLEREADGQYAFRQELFRRVAYGTLPYRRRRELHGRIGDVLAKEGGDAEDALPLLSLHFSQAGRPVEAWRYSVEAGARAARLLAPVEAARLFERALVAAPAAMISEAEVSRVARACGDAYELAAQYDAAAVAYRTARRSAADPLTLVEVLLKEGVLRERTGRYRAAVRWYMRGQRTVRSLEPTPEVQSLAARLDVALAATRHRQGRLEDCLRGCLRALPQAEASGDRGALAHAYYLLDATSTELGRPESHRYRELALSIYRELGDLIGEADVLNNSGVDAYFEGDLEAALEHYAQCRAARTRAGDVVGAAVATNNIAEVASDEGRRQDAARLFDEALRVFEAVDYPIGLALVLGNQGLLALRDGRWEEAGELLVDARARFDALGAAPFVGEMDERLSQLEAAVAIGARSILSEAPAVTA